MPDVQCPNASDLSDLAVHCRCLGIHVAGIKNQNYPCIRCESQWANNDPPDPEDRSTWTPALLEIYYQIKAFANAKPGPPSVATIASSLPTFDDFLSDFPSAAAVWRERGHLITDEATFRARVAMCMGDESAGNEILPCMHWHATKRRCRAGGGCTACSDNNMHLVNQKCPIGKWNTKGNDHAGNVDRE